MRTVGVGDSYFHINREAICDWLQSNGIDPNCTFRFAVGEAEIMATQFVRNDKGKFYVDETGDAVTAERQFPRALIRRPWLSKPLPLPLPSAS